MSTTRKPTHPGALIRHDYLERLNISVTDLATHLRISPEDLTSIIEEKANITLGLALRLSRAFNTSPALWLDLQKKWDIWEARNDSSDYGKIEPLFKVEIHKSLHRKQRRTHPKNKKTKRRAKVISRPHKKNNPKVNVPSISILNTFEKDNIYLYPTLGIDGNPSLLGHLKLYETQNQHELHIDKSDLLSSFYSIWATMLYPKKEQHPKRIALWSSQYAKNITSHIHDNTINNKLEFNINSNLTCTSTDLLEALIHNDSPDKILSQAIRYYPFGLNSSHILLHLYVYNDQDKKNKTINKAIYTASKRALKSNKNTERSSIERKIWNHWKSHKSVSHLWASFTVLLMCDYTKGKPQIDQLENWLTESIEHIFRSPEKLSLFFSVAKHFENFAASLTDGNNRPVFNSNEIWKVPNSIKMDTEISIDTKTFLPLFECFLTDYHLRNKTFI